MAKYTSAGQTPLSTPERHTVLCFEGLVKHNILGIMHVDVNKMIPVGLISKEQTSKAKQRCCVGQTLTGDNKG